MNNTRKRLAALGLSIVLTLALTIAGLPGLHLRVSAALSTNVDICKGDSVILNALPFFQEIGLDATFYIWSPATGLSSTTGEIVTASPAYTTTYTVTGTDGSDQTRVVSLTVTVHPLPNAGTITGSNGVVESGATITLSSSGDAGGDWTSSNPSVATITATGEVTALIPGTTTITYTVTNAHGCSSDTTLNLIVIAAPIAGDAPFASPRSLTITKGSTGSFTVNLGSGTNAADSATVTSNDTSIATVDIANVATPSTTATVTVTGVSKGATDITVAFSGGMGGTKTVHVTVTDPASQLQTPRDRSSDSGGSSYTPPVATIPSTLVVDAAKARTALAERIASGAGRARIRHNGEINVLGEAWAVFGNVPVDFDTTGSPVQVRVTVREPGKMTGDRLMSGYVKGSTVDSRKAFFEKWFKNKVRVIHLDQAEPWGQLVDIAAKVDLTGMDTANLNFYSYDSKTNTYRRIEKPAYWIDKNGYLHFAAEYAGDIVISEGPLAKK